VYLTSYVSFPSPRHFISSSSFSLSYPSNPLSLILISSFLSFQSSLPYPLIFFLILPILSSLSSHLLSYPSNPLFLILSSSFLSFQSSLPYPPHPPIFFLILSILPVFLSSLFTPSFTCPLFHTFLIFPLFLILPLLSFSFFQSSSLSAPFSYFLISSLPYLHHPSRHDFFYLTHLNFSPLYYYYCFSNNLLPQPVHPSWHFYPKFICITYPGFLSSFQPRCTVFSHSALYRQFCSLRPLLGTVDKFYQ
jgi:hypothetical protein